MTRTTGSHFECINISVHSTAKTTELCPLYVIYVGISLNLVGMLTT